MKNLLDIGAVEAHAGGMSTLTKGDFVRINTRNGGLEHHGAVGIVMRPVNVDHEDENEHTYMVWFGPRSQAPFYRDEIEEAE